MYKRILVAIDESKQSHIALREAIMLAKSHRAKLMIVNVLDEYYDSQSGPFILPEEYDQSLREFGKKMLEKAKNTAKKAGVKADYRLIELHSYKDRIAESIAEEAKRWRANLLVIGTHGRRGFHRFLLGSVAEGVVRMATVPVLLIKKLK